MDSFFDNLESYEGYSAEPEVPVFIAVNPTTPLPPVKPSQARRNKMLAKIHILAAECGWNEAYYRKVLSSRYAVSSCKELTMPQLGQFLSYLERTLASKKQRLQDPIHAFTARPGGLTQKQLNYIEAMWRKVSRATDYSGWIAGLRALCKRQTGCDDLRFVPRQLGEKLILALQDMVRQCGAQ